MKKIKDNLKFSFFSPFIFEEYKTTISQTLVRKNFILNFISRKTAFRFS
jgi:hypothetical protein